MDKRPQQIVDFANAGQIAEAEKLMAETALRKGLSGQDRQTCEYVIAQAEERAAAVVEPTKAAPKPKRKTVKRRSKK